MLWWTLRRLRSTAVDVRVRAVTSLASVGPSEATYDPRYARVVQALAEAATDPAWQVRVSAALALEKAGARFVSTCAANARPRPVRVTDRNVRESRPDPLQPTPYGTSHHLTQARAFVDAQVHAAVQERDRRETWIRCLGMLKEDRIGQSLVKLLGDEHPAVQGAAHNAFSDLGEQSVRVLAAVVTDGREPRELRIAAIAALGNLGDRRAADVLVEALSEHTEISTAACDALADIGDSAVEPLMVVLRRMAAHVRPPSGYTDHDRENPDFPREVLAWNASEALGRIGTPAIARLTEALENADAAVRVAARITLQKAQGEVSISALRKVREYKSPVLSQPIAAKPEHELIVLSLRSSRMCLVEGVTMVLVDAEGAEYSRRFAVNYGNPRAGGTAELLFEVPEGATIRLLRVGERVIDLP